MAKIQVKWTGDKREKPKPSPTYTVSIQLEPRSCLSIYGEDHGCEGCDGLRQREWHGAERITMDGAGNIVIEGGDPNYELEIPARAWTAFAVQKEEQQS